MRNYLPHFVLLLSLLLTSCDRALVSGGQPSADTNKGARTFLVKGVVKELKGDGKTVVIAHEEIPGYMQAMTMPLQVRDSAELATIRPGDRISFRLSVTETDGWIAGLTKLDPIAQAAPASPALFRVARYVEPLKIGDALPDYRFTNELAREIHLNQYRGEALALTFIYTRCPFPLFCPRVTSNFSALSERLQTMANGPTNWHLLTISFDPENDTPQALHAYADRYHYDLRRWSFLTGALTNIDAITEQFGLVFPRGETGFDHNLRTVVVNRNGQVQRVFSGNEWKVDDLAAELVTAALANRTTSSR